MFDIQTPKCVFISFQKCVKLASCWRKIFLFPVKCWKFPFIWLPRPRPFECGGRFISTHKKKWSRFKESSCTSSSLKSNMDSMLPRAYQHIYFQSINAAFKTLTQLTFLLSEWTTQNYSRSPKGIPNYLITLIFHVLEVLAHATKLDWYLQTVLPNVSNKSKLWLS